MFFAAFKDFISEVLTGSAAKGSVPSTLLCNIGFVPAVPVITSIVSPKLVKVLLSAARKSPSDTGSITPSLTMFQVSTPVSLPCSTTPLVPSSVHSFTAGINRPNGVALPKAIFKKLPTVGATSFTIISPKEFTCLALSVSNTLRFASSLDACIRAYVSFIFFPKSKSLVL